MHINLKAVHVGIAVAVALSVLRWAAGPFFDPIEQRLLTLKFKARGPRPVNPDLVIVGIDAQAIAHAGHWPWPRRTLAELIRGIAARRPALIGVDLCFSERGPSPGEDAALAAAIRDAGTVVLGNSFMISPREAAYQAQGEFESRVSLIRKSAVNMVDYAAGAEQPLKMITGYGVETNLPDFNDAARSTGFMNILPESDGSLTYALPLIQAGTGVYGSIAVGLFREFLGASSLALQVEEGYPRAMIFMGGKARVRIAPLDPLGRFLINYYGGTGSFATCSALDILSGRRGLPDLKGKVVMIGGTALGSFELRPTAFTATMPSVELQCTILGNLIDGTYITEGPFKTTTDVAAILLLGLLVCLVVSRCRTLWMGGLSAAIITAGYLACNYLAFSRLHLQMGLIFPIASIIVSYFATMVVGYLYLRRSSFQLQKALARVEGTMRSRQDGGFLAESILETVMEFLDAERGMILFYEDVADPQPTRIIPSVLKGCTIGLWDDPAFAYCRDRIRETERTRQAVLVEQARKDPRFPAAGGDGALCSLLCVPVMLYEAVLGFLYVDNDTRRKPFSRTSLPAVRSFVSRLALVMELAGLYNRLKLEKDHLKDEVNLLRASGDGAHGYPHIVGKSVAMMELIRTMEKAIHSSITVLLQGETGTGKELIARTIHLFGPRKDHSFVAQNCSALPEPLLESELFGHAKGSFTGAIAAKEGLFTVADKGTIFLDEIGDMPLSMQAKLLRVLQEGKIRPLGETRERTVDVRVISATHKNLEEEVRAGRFREDLYYRLNVLPIRIPPLRERVGDIPLLVQHYVRKFSEELEKKVTGISHEAMRLFSEYSYAGNVRELENEIERIVTLMPNEGAITPDMFSPKFIRAHAAPAGPPPVRLEEALTMVREAGLHAGTLVDLLAPGETGLQDYLDVIARELCLRALAKNDGNKAQTARALRMSRSGFQGMLERLGIRA